MLRLGGRIHFAADGLGPMDTQLLNGLPRGQMAALQLGFVGDGSLSPDMALALADLVDTWGEVLLEDHVWQRLSGSVALVWSQIQGEAQLSMGFAQAQACQRVLQALSKEPLAEGVLPAASESPQVFEDEQGRLWWLRQDPGGHWWLSPNQRLLLELAVDRADPQAQSSSLPSTEPSLITLDIDHGELLRLLRGEVPQPKIAVRYMARINSMLFLPLASSVCNF